MLKNNFSLLFLPLILVGCSRSKEAPTLISRLQKIAPEEKVLHRALASTGADKCMHDIFTVETLRQEVAELEKKFSAGTKVTGIWKHLNLEDLPIPQANFLKKYGDKLGDVVNPDSIDYAGTTDVPSIYNRIYGKENHVAGYVHYLWYLKFGHMLAADNEVYHSYNVTKKGEYNGKTFSVSAYLYNDKELYGLWKLTRMLKGAYTNLTHMVEVQRLPRGERFEDAGAMTCGLAWSNGYIILQDGCLSVYENMDSGYLYAAVSHEMSHQVDFFQGRNIYKSSYRSQQQDYLDLAGFILNEYKDENEKTVKQWAHKPGAKMITSYGGSSPAENFAETLAYFRVDGNHTKGMITKEHLDFTSLNYFSSKYFDSASLMKAWVSENSTELARIAFDAVVNCSESSKKYASTFFKRDDFSVPLLPTMLNCLGSKATEASLKLRAKIKVKEPEACKAFISVNEKVEWESAFKPQLISLMSGYLSELQKDQTYLAKIQSFYDELSDRTLATKAYLDCYGEESEEGCFENAVTLLALKKVEPLNLPDDHAQELAGLYLSQHSYPNTQQNLLSFYRDFVVSHKAITDKVAEELWSQCLALPQNDDETPTGKYLSLEGGYMVSSLYNCLNLQFPEKIKDIVRDLSVEGMKVQHPKEEIILNEKVIPELQQALKELYTKHREEEVKAAIIFEESDEGKLRKELQSDFSWVKNVLDSEKINSDCQKIALDKISFNVLYHMKRPLFSKLITQSCEAIHTSSEFNEWLEESKSVFESKALDGLDDKIMEKGNAQAKVCIQKYPMDTNLNRIKFKKEREACLIDEWSNIEAGALKEFENDPLVIKFKIDLSAMKSKLDAGRRRLQLKVIKEHF